MARDSHRRRAADAALPGRGEADRMGDALAAARARLRSGAVPAAALDARLLLAHVLGPTRTAMLDRGADELSEDQARDYAALVARREAGEPVSRIIGQREFWSLCLRVTPATFDPRPDSETVIEAALADLPGPSAALDLADLGTGTGCLLLALLTELPGATGVGVDLSPAAVAVAHANAVALGLADRAWFVAGDWGSSLAGPFDLIVANPPYVAEGSLATLEADVAFEPRLALAGGRDGLGAYRALAPDVARLLRPSGRAVFEVGAGQADAVGGIVAAAGLGVAGTRRDLAGIERCIIANLDQNFVMGKKRVGMKAAAD